MSVDGDDDSNPMHAFGHGRGDDYKPRRTQAYSFVDPQRIVNVGESKVEPTQPMEAVPEIMSVKDVVHRLVERNLQAWKALPEKIRDRMLESPQDFQLVPAKRVKDSDFDWAILYNGTVWHYHTTAVVWMIHDILR